ncbi:MAG TPA: zinc ribbon domain-containing protein [Methanoregula sp.]|nr:zinc ribbon domain-containing protein [Methanoregula sp.]
MTKKCGNCGAPAPDNNSKFCDLCGTPLEEEQAAPQEFPVCPTCGATVSDKKAIFCDACGGPLAKPVCPACGNTAPSMQSKFCTRCGATFASAMPGKRRAVSPPDKPVPAQEYEPEPEPVVVKQRRGRQPVQQENPAEEWDPWTDGDPTYDIAPPAEGQQQEQPTDLQRVAAEMERSRQTEQPKRELPMAQMSVPRKKYSHLPLIADELKDDMTRRSAAYGDEEGKNSSHGGKKGKKKGLFG